VAHENSLNTDVLVIGGGMAGAWAALGAVRTGARVTLVDKGYCGTSGVTATAGPGHWWVPPAEREQAVRQRAANSGGLAEASWMRRIIETTWEHLPTLARHYRFPVDANGRIIFRALRGPEYMKALRAMLNEAGVTVLDHHPALELLRDEQGRVAGAAGLRRVDQQAWRIGAGAVVLASGGCAFLSKLLGADNNTGDGLLMAAEVGAELSGMEFSNFYTVAPACSSMTRAMSYVFARYFDAQGRELDIPAGPDTIRALALALDRGPVSCSLDRMPQDLREALPTISPNVMLPFTRHGIDPFRDRFEIVLRGEGTVRGIGGLRVAGDDCQTTVPGLFVAGDAASRERVAGAVSGGGSINSAWALSSGLWAGAGAARHARDHGAPRGLLEAAGTLTLRSGRATRAAPDDATLTRIVRELQTPMLHPMQILFRQQQALTQASELLEGHWQELQQRVPAEGALRLKARQTAAMVASARWITLAAQTRRESRGMHLRSDLPHTDPAQTHRLSVGGLHKLWIRPHAVVQPIGATA